MLTLSWRRSLSYKNQSSFHVIATSFMKELISYVPITVSFCWVGDKYKLTSITFRNNSFYHISLKIPLSLYPPLKSSGNHRFSDDVRVSRIYLIRLNSPNIRRARSLVVTDLHSETKGSQFKCGCYLCAEVRSLQ